MPLVFWTVVLIIGPVWAGIAVGVAVAERSATWLGWVAGIIVFWILASLMAFVYRKVRRQPPTADAVQDYYGKHREKVVHTARVAQMDGLDVDLAMLHAYAVLPPIGEIKMAGFNEYYKAVNRAAWAYAKASKAAAKRGADRNERENLALDALNRYAVIGQQHNDTWLPSQIDETIRTYMER